MKRIICVIATIVLPLTVSNNIALAISSNDEDSIYNDSVWYDSSGESSITCADGQTSSGGATGSINGVRFPAVDPKVLEQAIKDYIQNGWPQSPLINYADDFVRLGQQNNVNPIIPVMIAQVEFGFGTHPDVQPGAYRQYNFWAVTNNPTPTNRFGPYPSIIEAMEDHYRLLSGAKGPPYTYIGPPQNFTTISQIMNQYAPAFENDTAGYIKIIEDGFKKLGGSTEPITTDSNGCSINGETGSVDVSGLAFPVEPQRQSQNSGVPGMSPLPCSGSCHHDGTVAFDISRKPGGGSTAAGTAVYAITDGIIDNQHVYNNIEGCFSLHIANTKGGYDYYYTHLRNPVYKSGDKVFAGQKVAEIGENKCTGNGSDSHLHIERGCVRGGIPQVAGNLSCRDPALREVINSLFNNLPR